MGKMKKTTHNFMQYIMKHKFLVLLWLLVTAVVSFVAPLKNFILQWIIDSHSKNEAVLYLLLGIGIICLSHLGEIVCRTLYTAIESKAIKDVRDRLVTRLFSRSMAEYNDNEDAAYISTLTTDMRTLYDDYYSCFFNIVFWGGILLCAIGMYIYISPLMLPIVILVCAFSLIVPKYFSRRLQKARSDFSEQLKHYTHHIKELLAGFETIRSFHVEKSYDALHRNESEESANREAAMYKSLNTMVVASSFFSALSFYTVTLLGMYLVFDGIISMGAMVTAASLANFVISPCQMSTQNLAKMKSTKGIREKIAVLLESESGTEGGDGIIQEVRDITIANVSFAYPECQAVLHDISLQIRPYEKVAITGASGCGKSTLAKLLCRYYDTYQGSIQINGIEINQISKEILTGKIGYASQRTHLFCDTIRNNVCLYESYTQAQIDRALQLAGLEEFINSLPDGVDTQITENGKNLSGGQIQRIGIARLIIRDYEVIITDEITANLDKSTAISIMNHLLALNCTMISITHEINDSYMDKFDHKYLIQDGRIENIRGNE